MSSTVHVTKLSITTGYRAHGYLDRQKREVKVIRKIAAMGIEGMARLLVLVVKSLPS